MDKIIITVLGQDRPGIIAMISNILFDLECNLENVNQMILQGHLAGFFIVEPPTGTGSETLAETIMHRTCDTGLSIHINTFCDNKNAKDSISKGDTFLITTIGPDQKGLVAKISAVIAEYKANIEDLKAVFKGGMDPESNIMSYRVFITDDTDRNALFNALRQKARELDLDIRIQHRNIFDAINKI